MKKILVVVIALIGFSQAEAQVTFKPGVRAGVNFSHFTQGDELSYYDSSFGTDDDLEFKSKTDFYVGFYGALRLTRYYTLQPEITYSRQGSKFNHSYFNSYYDNNIGQYVEREIRNSGQYDISYLSIAVINKFTFNDRFNLHVGPTIDFIVEKEGDVINSSYDNGRPTDVDLAFVAGFGFNATKNFGIEARIKKGIVPVIETSYNDHTNVNFSIGATYTFDLK